MKTTRGAALLATAVLMGVAVATPSRGWAKTEVRPLALS